MHLYNRIALLDGGSSYSSVNEPCAHAKLLQSCLILCDHMDGGPPGSSVRGILQARILEWGAMQGIFLTQGLYLHL